MFSMLSQRQRNAFSKAILSAPRRSHATSLILALLALSIAACARYGLSTVMPASLPYLPFFAALLIAGALASIFPALGLGTVAAVIGIFWIDPPQGQESYFRIVGILLFLFAAAVIVVLTESLEDANGRIADHDKRARVVNEELAHRLRNLFQIVNAIIAQTIKTNNDPRALEAAVAGRLKTLGEAQSLITLNPQNVSIPELLDITVAPLAPEMARLRLDGPPVTLGADTISMLSLVLYELATNALKHGAWSDPKGIVSIRWTETGRLFTLDWAEHDGPPVNMPDKLGGGSRLIRGAIPDATVDYNLEQDGARCRIELPLNPS